MQRRLRYLPKVAAFASRSLSTTTSASPTVILTQLVGRPRPLYSKTNLFKYTTAQSLHMRCMSTMETSRRRFGEEDNEEQEEDENRNPKPVQSSSRSKQTRTQQPEIPDHLNICRGCGSHFQCESQSLAGYVPDGQYQVRTRCFDSAFLLG